MPKTIGEMGDHEARMVMLRASLDAFGEVPVYAQRLVDGGYTLTLRATEEIAASGIRCAAEVGVDYDVRGFCGRELAHNYHRPDTECDDPDAHTEDAPYTLHHPFVFPAQEAHQ